MTTTNNRIAEKINLVEPLNAIYGHFTDPKVPNKSKEDGTAFKIDFPRTGEIRLIINGKSWVYYKMSDSEEDEAKHQSEFIKRLKEQRPELAGVVMKELNQAGAFYTGRITMEAYFFARAAIRSKNKHHRIIINVANKNEVIVEETISYKSLIVGSAENAVNMVASNNTLKDGGFLCEEKQKNLENYRNSRKAQAELGPKDDYGIQELVFPEGQPLSLTVQYPLRYCEKTGTYEMKVPSEDDIALTVPTDLAERLVFDDKWTIGDKISEFIAKLVEIVRQLVIGKVSEGLVTEQSRQDQVEPSYYMDRPRI